MAALQRSAQTFRRSGSSGLIWDDRFFSSDLNEPSTKEEEGASELKELRHSRSVGGVMELSRTVDGRTMERSHTDVGRHGQAFRSRTVMPASDPPSPELSGCISCAIFGKRRPSNKPVAPRKH